VALLEAALILLLGFLVGYLTRLVATAAAVVALALAVLGMAAPPAFFDLLEPISSVYAGNELVFIAGFLFAIGASESRE
jgi:hypothetical protein